MKEKKEKDDTPTEVLDEEIVREILDGESPDAGSDSRLVRLKRSGRRKGPGGEPDNKD